MSRTEKKRIVVVLGMHRSGTSVITRGLQVLGVDLGNHLMPAAGDNSKGFWEDLDINALNIDLMASMGHDWHTLAPIESMEFQSPAIDALKVRAIDLLRNKLAHAECFGLKDPRIARLLPFWQEIFSALNLQVNYVIACRNPISISQSLAERNGFHPEKSYQLWLDHILNILNQTRNGERIVVDYDRLMADPAGQLARIAKSLHLRFSPAGPAYKEFQSEFLDQSLQHSRYGLRELKTLQALPPSVVQLYGLLLEFAKDAPVSAKAKASLERVTERWQENRSALRYMRFCEDKLAGQDAEIGQLQEAIHQRDRELTKLQDVVSERDRKVAELANTRESLATRNLELDKLTEVVRSRDGEITKLHDALAQYGSVIGDLRKTASEYDREIARLNKTVELQIEEIVSRNFVLRRMTAPLRLLKRLAKALVHPLRSYRLGKDIRVVRNSGLFDPYYYLSTNLDVRIATADPIRHYCDIGWKEFRNPAANFDTQRYLNKNPQVRAAGTNPFVHHINSLQHNTGQRPRPGLFSRGIIAVCVFPATFFHFNGWRGWFGALTKGRSFFGDVLNRPGQSYERLAIAPRVIAVPVSVLLSAALRIRKNGGLSPTLRNLYRVLRKEGRSGLTRRLMERAPHPVQVVPSAHSGPSRVVVMDYRVPMADISAGERATVGILRDLCAIGFDVVFLPNNMVPCPPYEEELRRYGVTVITSADGYHSPAHYLNECGHTVSAFYLVRVDVVEAVLDTIRRVSPQAPVIFHAPDVYFLREGREADLKNEPALHARAAATRERELAIMRQVDRTVVVSPAEVPAIRAYLPECKLSVLPALYAPIVATPARFNARRDIFFLGGFAHTPNVDAVHWFVKAVWPLVRKELPDAKFHIVGSEAPQSVLDLSSEPGVVVDGFVKDLDPVLSSMRVGVAPLRFGAGIKGKVAVSMGAGIPCVCTTIAAEGMGLEHGANALIADDVETFARNVVDLYSDAKLWQKLSESGRESVRLRFSAEANRSALLYVLNEVGVLPLDVYIAHCRAIAPRPVPCPGDGQAVDVSVIVPVYNQWDYTRACLNSILEASLSEAVRYEIILADDGSSDDTVDASRYFPGLRVVKTPKNLGFLRNCNNAAKHARGKYLLLLNNDTVVLPGWLSSLFSLGETDSSAAMIGSKLLYPDETIQEAGGVLWNDATACNCGRYLPRRTPRYMQSREVDYVSGSSFLIRKSFWDSVGGFDERYKNAYCEDSDLAMTARATGMRVMYQPLSEVVHFEHKTYTGERQNYLLPVQRENIQRLQDKWREVFASAHLPPATPPAIGMANAERTPSPAAIARRRLGHLNVLYFSPFPSHPSNHGNQATIQQFGRRFQSMGHKVHFALLQSHLFSEEVVKDMQACWDTLDIIPNSHPLGSNGQPIPFDGWYEEGLGERIYDLCAKYDIDVVFCSYVFQSRLLDFVPTNILKVIDTHDKMSNRYEMLRANGQPLEFFSCTPEEEGAYMRRADIVVARREEEARYFDSITGRTTAIVVPHIEEPRFAGKAFTRLRNVGIVASANRINLAIVRECLESIDRRLRGSAPDFTVHIAGQVRDMMLELPARETGAFRKPWVRMHGFVPDIEAFYADMDLVLSPVTMGTGINVKTVQAMAFGMPLLTTACGIKGIETGEPQHHHPDIDSLVSGMFSLLDRPAELGRLAAVSRDRYGTFYKSGVEAINKAFSHPKLTLDTPQNAGAADGGGGRLILKRDDPNLSEGIYRILCRYFQDGERGSDVAIADELQVHMDGEGAAAYVADVLSRGQIHDQDYAIFRAFTSPKDVILDIGANWGYSVASIWASGAKTKVISFEPIVAYQACLKKIKETYSGRYDFRMTGLADVRDRLKFVVPVVNGIAISALSSANHPSSGPHLKILAQNIRDHVLQWMPDVQTISLKLFEFEAPVARLDDVLEGDGRLLKYHRVAAIKIDVEGLEFDVLKGAEATLRRYKPLIALEGGNRFEGLSAFMAAMGYFYAERQGDSLAAVQGTGQAVNGFFVHHSNVVGYEGLGILDVSTLPQQQVVQ